MVSRWKLALLLGMLAISLTPAVAAPNFLGQSGNILTPDDIVVPRGEFSASYHHLNRKIFGPGDHMNIFAANYGLMPDLEIGFAFVERDSTRFLVNGKYHLLPERRGRPSVTVGVVDLFDDLNRDPGAYLIVGKDVAGSSGSVRSRTKGWPLHAFIGAGTGPYGGILAGLTYTGPRFALMLEYAPEGPLTGRRNSVNLGARHAIGRGFRIEAALFNFDHVGIGLSLITGVVP